MQQHTNSNPQITFRPLKILFWASRGLGTADLDYFHFSDVGVVVVILQQLLSSTSFNVLYLVISGFSNLKERKTATKRKTNVAM